MKYLGCILDATLSGEAMALYVINKINSRLRFLYRNNQFLSGSLRRLLCNALIQPHFDFACTAWYPNLNLSLKKKLQVTQNKCIRFCLKLGNRSHIGNDEFAKINWLNVKDRFEQNCSVYAFKFFKKNSPSYIKDIFESASIARINTRNNF